MDSTVNEIRPTHWRALWISDIHLGTAGCKAEFLLDFLEHNDSDTLYLVGDIVDGWQLRKHWHWPRAHNDVIQRILRKARNGTRVVFIPGNHDEFAREFAGYAFGDIEILDEDVHVTAKGMRLLVLHGDQFDGVIQHSRWLAHLGDGLYQLALWINHHFNRLRHRLGLHYWSLSQYLKHKVKNAVSFITDFEEALAGEAAAAWTGWSAAISTRPSCATWAASCTATTATGWKACRPWPRPMTASCNCWTGPRSRPNARPTRRSASRARCRCRRCRRRCAARASTRDNPYTSPLRNGDIAVHGPLGHACNWGNGQN